MPTNKQRNQPHGWIPYEDDEVDPIQMPENDVCLDNCNISLTDALINAEVLLIEGRMHMVPLLMHVLYGN